MSIFALNLSVAMGLALAIDYTLLIVSRYRDELAAGSRRDEALIRTMATAGRTVLYSAMTVALSMVAMVLFPMYYPEVVRLRGDRRGRVRRRCRRRCGARGDRLARRSARRTGRAPADPACSGTTRTGAQARRTEHLVPVDEIHHAPVDPGRVAIIALLLVLAHRSWAQVGLPRRPRIAASLSARTVGDQMRDDFAVDSSRNVTIVVPDATGVTPQDLGRYAAELSRVADVSSVSSQWYLHRRNAGRAAFGRNGIEGR